MHVDFLAAAVVASLDAAALPGIRPVINATGVVLHTNLGRAPIHEDAARAAYEAARGYVNLELNLATGKRASRQEIVRAGLRSITGAESATAVNNCAAATVIALRAVAGREQAVLQNEVIVSRGQLVEIGGSFRIPEVMAASGAVLREVGTTNITRLSDYERAISREYRRADARSRQQLPGSRLYEIRRTAATRRTGPQAPSPGDRRRRQRPGGRPRAVRLAGRTASLREHRRRRRPGSLQRRQAPWRAAMRHPRGEGGTDSDNREGSAHARLPARQDDARRARSYAPSLPRSGAGDPGRAGLAHADNASGEN